MKVKIWGGRGSLPAPLSPEHVASNKIEFLKKFFEKGHKAPAEINAFIKTLQPYELGGYGGNTPCIEVKTDTTQVIVDGGSGIRSLGYQLLGGACGKGQGEVHILFTHFHWDHLIGLPFFVPIFIPKNKIHVYSVQPELKEVFQTVFKKPYFPVPLESLESEIIYHQLEPRKKTKIGDIEFTPYQLDHPDPCWGYRFEHGGKVFSHCVDTEATRVTPEDLGPDLPLYQGVDLMIFDAQYSLVETVEKIDWGHAAASIGLDIAMREGVKRVLFMHHDPASIDAKIAKAEREARKYYESQLKAAQRGGVKVHEVDWSFAHEGLETLV